MIFKFFDNLNTILCKQMRLMFTYFSSKLQVSSNIVKTNVTCVYIVCLPNLQHLHTLIFILKLKLVLWFILSVILVLLFHVFGIQNSYKLQFLLKGEFAVVPTVKICGRNLSSKIPVDINSIFMKLYVTWPTWPKGHIPQKFEFSKWFL
jgi:hypothetical protein